MSFDLPPIGSIAYGKSGSPCLVKAIRSNFITLQKSDGSEFDVVRNAIVRWHPPELSQNPRPVSEEKIGASSGFADDIQTHSTRQGKLEIYRPYPGSIGIPVTERVRDVLQGTTDDWTIQALWRLPYLGRPTIDQVKGACKRLVRQGLAREVIEGKERFYRGKHAQKND
jgi:hypothetical protein